MLSKRLQNVADFIEKEDCLIDIGCDHAYLGIYLVKNNLIKDILLTDINQNALNNAINNIKENNLEIKTKLTDGLNNIDLKEYNTITISGMGANTITNILKVLKDNKSINKIIIQSNNDLDIIRKFMPEINFYLNDEITINEKNIFYITQKFTHKKRILNEEEILFGINKKDKTEYYKYLVNNYQEILPKIPDIHQEEKETLKNKINILEKLLEESR